MAEKHEPSLELPSWRRRGRREVAVSAVVDPAPAPRSARSLPGQMAAATTGVVVGLAAVGLVWLGQHSCQAISGTSSCGGAAGLLMLTLVVVVLALLGAGLLRVLGGDRAGSTSTLAVALAAVVTLLLFSDVLFEVRGAVLVVFTIVVAYVVAQAVTSAAGD